MICLAFSLLRLCLRNSVAKLWYPAHTLPVVTLAPILCSVSKGPGCLYSMRGGLKQFSPFMYYCCLCQRPTLPGLPKIGVAAQQVFAVPF